MFLCYSAPLVIAAPLGALARACICITAASDGHVEQELRCEHMRRLFGTALAFFTAFLVALLFAKRWRDSPALEEFLFSGEPHSAEQTSCLGFRRSSIQRPWRNYALKAAHFPGVVEKRLAQLGLHIPRSPAPAANYVPWRRSGNMVFISGQIPKKEDNSMLKGKLGADYNLQQGKDAAAVCAVNLISQMREACGGDLDKVKAILRVEGFVNATEDFTDHPQVVNGCSDLLVDVFGMEVGAHTRFAVGCSSLPFGVAVETGAVIEVTDE